VPGPVADVEGMVDDLHGQPGQPGPAHPSHQFLGLAGEHGAGDHLQLATPRVHPARGPVTAWAASHAGHRAAPRRTPPAQDQTMARLVSPQAARATHIHASPIRVTIGRWSARPRYMPATAYMPSGKTMLHSVGVYRRGTFRSTC